MRLPPLLSMEARTICSASPTTAMFGLWVTRKSWRRFLASLMHGTRRSEMVWLSRFSSGWSMISGPSSLSIRR